MGLAAAVAGSSVLGLAGTAISASAASNAADKQSEAEKYAADEMQKQYQQTRSDLLPYNTAGQAATSAIENTPAFSYGAFNFNPTEANIEATPGYQFDLSQGLKATQNSAAARGLGTSGAALKGAATYATGLADNTWQNQFQRALDSYTTNYGTAQGVYGTNLAKEQNLAGLGENAAAQTGNFGTTTAANIGQTAVGAANAQAAGAVGVANSVSSGLGSISNGLLSNAFFNNPATAGGGVGIYGLAGQAAADGVPADMAGLY